MAAMMQDTTWTLTSRWIIPVEGEPLEWGTVTIREGRIAAVEADGHRTADLDLGNAAVLPGFVNTHTHLDLSGLKRRLTPSEDFIEWLRQVVSFRQAVSPSEVNGHISDGIRESISLGTTLIGDISSQGMTWNELSAAPLRSVVFYELLGLTKTRAMQSWARACQWLSKHPATTTCRPGLSPHAPYSVRASLFRAASFLSHYRKIS